MQAGDRGHLLLRFIGAKQLPLVRQSESAECGLACLTMIANYYGYDVDLPTLRQRLSVSLKGVNLRSLLSMSSQIGLSGRAISCDLDHLSKLRIPCVLHWNFTHFVVMHKVQGHKIWINDPASGSLVLTRDEFSKHFTGIAVEFSPTESFERKSERQTLKLKNLFRWLPEIKTSAIQGVALSAVLQLIALLIPLYFALVIDQVVQRGDKDFLIILAVAFGLLSVFNVATTALRSFVLQFLSNTLSFDMAARLCHHLMRLPLEFYQKRSVGDLQQRFQSTEAIRQTIVDGGIAIIIDGAFAVVTCAIMFVYNAWLGMIVLGVVVAYVLLRVAMYSMLRRYTMEAIAASAREQTLFLENIRAFQTIKTTNSEVRREEGWQNLYAGKLNAAIKSGNLSITFQTLQGLLSGISDILIIYLAATSVLNGQMTLGLVTAFLAYKAMFMGRMLALIEQALKFKMLSVHLERASEIALAPKEEGIDAPGTDELISGRVTANRVGFRYGPSEKPVIDGLDLDVKAGEFISIIGPSGIGKTTLVKVLLGLYKPYTGQVCIDGKDISAIGLNNFRAQTGVVMQEDTLLFGTIAANIALFDETPDMGRVKECARLAQIHDEIEAFPMQYNSIIGEMGSTLSTGQRQRALIARALYRNPKILVLDEGTAQVDPQCEQRLIEMIKSLPITRIVVAHSMAMATAADRVFELEAGTLRLVERSEQRLTRKQVVEVGRSS